MSAMAIRLILNLSFAAHFRSNILGAQNCHISTHEQMCLSGGVLNTEAGKKVLIVEDNQLNMKLFSDLLLSMDLVVLKSEDGSDAIELAQAHKPNLILMDIQLPGRSGLDLTQILKADEETKSIPIVAVTAFAMKGDSERILAAGCDGYIAKPISLLEFTTTVSKFIGLNQADSAP